MEKTIRNKEDLRDAWIMVKALTDLIPEMKKTDRCKQDIIDYKKAIRAYNKIKSDVRFIGGDYDGYVELIEFPEWMDIKEARQCFSEFHELHYYPSPYDCTGQRFTTGTKFFIRHDRVYCYHSVGADV